MSVRGGPVIATVIRQRQSRRVLTVTPNPYATSAATTPANTGVSRFSGWVGLAIGIAFTPVALYLSMLSAGAGHGDYGLAKVLYPIPVLILMCGSPAFVIALPLAVVQYPLFGILLGYTCRQGRRAFVAVFMLTGLIHVAALTFVFVVGADVF